MIPLNKPGYSKITCNSDYINRNFANFHVRMTVSARDGLNLIYRDLYEKRGSLRIGISPFTCFHAIYPIVENGHTPVFIDIDTDTFNMDASLLYENNIDGVEVVHLGGNPNDMKAIMTWAESKKGIVIEDCAQALGSTYDGIEVGKFGDYSVFSLIKTIHTVVGGLMLSKNEVEQSDMRCISKSMIVYRTIKNFLESHSNHHWYNVCNPIYLGLMKLKDGAVNNMRYDVRGVSEHMQKIIRRKIGAIEMINKKRIENAYYMVERVDDTYYSVQKVLDRAHCNRNRLIFKMQEPFAKQVVGWLRRNGIASNNLTQNYLDGFQPHVSQDGILSQYYDCAKLKRYDSIFNSVIAVPCSAYLSQNEMDYMIKKLNHFRI